MPVTSGTWVQIEQTILDPGERAPQVPQDTQKLPLQMWVKGTLLSAGELGDIVDVETAVGRQIRGKLVAVNPGYQHTFGAPIPALQLAGEKARRLLDEGVRHC
jgi:hypothetical protein